MSDLSLDTVTTTPVATWLDRVFNRLSGKRIELNDEPYLTRYYLIGDGSGRGYELYLHHLQQEDQSRWLHNHPWRWFFSIVLRGNYTQRELCPRTDTDERQVRIRFMNFFRGQDRYHSITKIPEAGTWTLVLVPPKTQDTEEWGYWNSETGQHQPDLDNDEENSTTIRFGPKQTFN
ncbi:MAG: hypothetical protein F4W90_01895 [Gammaproteobacteria bacterium]|nr:hypothetical protein [Gammaproteobacteria bacterium]